MPEPIRNPSLALLRWLVEAGADEATAEAPLNRFVTRPSSSSPREGEGGAPRVESAAMARRVGGESSSERPSASPLHEARTRASTLPQVEGAKKTQNTARMSANAEAVSLSTAPGAARALAQSCATLAQLKSALMQFDGCELKRYATNTVFADGSPSGRIMLIGEAPGRDEDEQGLPFVGRAGKLLDRMLAAIDLDRSKVYITNVLNWRPPQNREPSPEEAASCLPFLHRHIELADPQVLILLGAVSARHVLGTTEGIMRLRGKWNLYQNANINRAIPVMPTLHPAYLLRQPAAKRLAWRDLLAVGEKIEELGLA
jgi:DNA polymerase